MQHDSSRPASTACRPARADRTRPLVRTGALVLGLAAAGAAHAFEYGPFTLTGFAKSEIGWGSNMCDLCQREPGEDRHRKWADDLVYGKKFGADDTNGTLIQPNIGAKFDLPRGFKLSGLWSQRYRDGKPDFEGVLYELNATLQHEDYGTLQIGKFPSRTWAMADYPYATDIGMSPAFSDSGAGYGLLTSAVRYTSRILDVAEGDMVLEVTWDQGDTAFKRNKPMLLEYWLHYGLGPLSLEGMIQQSENGRPTAFSHGPFTALTSDPADDGKLGGSSQSIVMLLAKYQLNSRIELSGGIRLNRWSGAYAVQTSGLLWNAMFNVDWGGFDANGVPNPGYAARTKDVMLGMRYRMDKWTASTGLTHLGRASTNNPSDRGQRNTALFTSAGLNYNFGEGIQFYGSVNAVKYRQKGFAPLSMPGHSAFSNVDSRVADRGNWLTLGALYVF